MKLQINKYTHVVFEVERDLGFQLLNKRNTKNKLIIYSR